MARCMGWDTTERNEDRIVLERCRDVATETITGDYDEILIGFCERHWARDPDPIPADDPGASSYGSTQALRAQEEA